MVDPSLQTPPGSRKAPFSPAAPSHGTHSRVSGSSHLEAVVVGVRHCEHVPMKRDVLAVLKQRGVAHSGPITEVEQPRAHQGGDRVPSEDPDRLGLAVRKRERSVGHQRQAGGLREHSSLAEAPSTSASAPVPARSESASALGSRVHSWCEPAIATASRPSEPPAPTATAAQPPALPRPQSRGRRARRFPLHAGARHRPSRQMA